MSAFAALADELEGRKAPAAARGTGSFSEFNVSPDVQAGRDDERVKILRGELAQERDPKLRADIQLEIDRTAGGRPRASTASPAAPANPFMALADELEGARAPKVASNAPQRPPAREAPIAGQEEPGFLDRMGSAVKAALPQTVGEAIDPMYANKAIGEVATQQASGIGQAIMGGWRGLTALASGAGLDEAVRQVHAPELACGARAETYQPTTRQGQAAAEIAGAPGEGIAALGKMAGEGAQNAGASPGIATAVETGVNALPLVAGLKGAGTRVVGAQPKVVGSSSIADVAKGPAALEAPATNLDVPTYLRRPREPLRAAGEPRKPIELAPVEPAKPKGPSIFERPDATPEQTAAAAVAEAPKFVEQAPVSEGAALPKADQTARAKVLEAVGLGGKDVRKSAIEGDPAKARTEYDASRMEGTPEGAIARRVLDSEREALTRHAESIVADTGGTVGTDTAALYTRGDSIAKPFQGLKNWFDKNTKALYAEADKRAGGVPMELGNLKSVLGEDSAFAGSTEGSALRKGIESRMRELKMVDKDGNPLPATVEQAERLKQYLNDQWSPRTSRLINKVKEGIDTDVLSSAGEDIYAKARAMRAMRSRVFENDILDPQGRTIPNGVGKIFDASGKGIELLKATEQIPDAIARLPVDELAQVVKTLKHSVPPELQPQAKAALAEIKGQFANRILEAGSKTEQQWGAPGVSKYLNANAARLRLLFDDAELAKIKNLNDAGQILRIGPYPGAAVQSSNLARTVGTKAAELGGAGVGALVGTIVGGPVGTAAGTVIGRAAGSAAAGRYQAASDLRAFEKRFTRLGDIGKGMK